MGNVILCLTFVLPMTDTKTISITFRTTEELKKSLQLMADKEKRSVSNTIEMLLEKAIKDSQKKK